MCDHILKRLSLYLFIYIFKGVMAMTAEEIGLFYRITFVREMNFHLHSMHHSIVTFCYH